MATFLGPIVAIQVQKILESRRADRAEKLHVFRSLIATRATVLSPDRVQAYNMIDIVFYKDAGVREAWKALFDSFERKAKDATEEVVINEERRKLDIELLHIMAKSLGFSLDKTDLKSRAYFPEAHDTIEKEQHFLRKALVRMLLDDGAFRLKIVSVPDEDETQREFRKVLTEMYTTGKPWPVKLIVDPNEMPATTPPATAIPPDNGG